MVLLNSKEADTKGSTLLVVAISSVLVLSQFASCIAEEPHYDPYNRQTGHYYYNKSNSDEPWKALDSNGHPTYIDRPGDRKSS